MTFLNLDVRSKLTLGLLVALGCSSKVQIAESSSGGQSFRASGGSAATGGSTAITDGGALHATGGNATGIAGGNATGGTWNATGGTWNATGGTWSPTGGARNATGGTWAATGGNATGGAAETTGGAWTATGGAPHSYPNVGCTIGADQTCNNDPNAATLMGQCEADGWCTCIAPYVVILATGKCDTYPQSVCYSPTQNIDLAYVSRAFGCNCSSSTSTPYCGIDSGGLRVYLVCTGGVWQSGDTSNCKS